MNLKSLLSIKTKCYLKYFFSKNNHTYDCYRGKRKIVVCLGADYGNIGDIAITFSQIEFLKNLYPEYCVFEFPISSTFTDMKSLKSVIDSDDLITIVGGGNTSPRYEDIEDCREFIVKNFKNNKVISFPQSVETDNSFTKKLKKFYKKKDNIYFFAREKYSFDLYKEILSGSNVFLSPDIVFSYKIPKNNLKREIITVSLRNDKERLLNDFQTKELYKTLFKTDFRIESRDTQITDDVVFDYENRKNFLSEIILQYQKSKLVITDRLHGMIMAYITDTPCIVFSGDNTKIKGSYDWIRVSKKVKFYDVFSMGDFSKSVAYFLNTDFDSYYNKKINFDYLKNVIENIY